jgi:hypothetical protein
MESCTDFVTEPIELDPLYVVSVKLQYTLVPFGEPSASLSAGVNDQDVDEDLEAIVPL